MFARLIALFSMTAALAASAFATSPVFRPPPRLMESVGAETPIQLQGLKISTEISGSMAETTVQMVFFNPNSRQLEGTLQFPLLAGQQITAFALDIEGKLRPAVPVEKAKGRQIFEAIERRKVDPGLLEVTQGNNFKLRVYPIAARGTRSVEIKYSEALARDGKNWAYRLPLAYGDSLSNFDLSLRVSGSTAMPISSGALGEVSFSRQGDGFQAHVAKSRFSPNGVLTILIPAKTQAQVYVQERDNERYFVAEIPVSNKRTPRALPKTVGLLWDSSGSAGAQTHDAELAVLDLYFKKLGNIEVRLTRLRDRPEVEGKFQVVNGNWDALREALEKTVYDGASALADWQAQSDVEEYLLVSDGLLNYGPTRFPNLGAKQHLYALTSSVSADISRLGALAERNGGRVVQIQASNSTAAANALLTDGASIHNIRAVGASDIVSDNADSQQGLLRVAGKLLGNDAQITLTTVQDGKPYEIKLAVPANAPTHPLAAYLWASYKLHKLEADFELNRGAIRRLGTQFSIPTRETSLIVLERLDDYVRYDVTPPAELAAAFEQAKTWRFREQQKTREDHLEQVVREFQQKVVWWEKGYLKSSPSKVAAEDKATPFQSLSQDSRMLREIVPMQAAAAPMAGQSNVVVSGLISSKAKGGSSSDYANSTAEVGITLKKWTSNAPYIARLNSASAESIYRIYLDEKPSYLNSSAFFLDVADILIDKGQRDLALRVLSNLAEMDLENRHVLRILGYRLMQAGAPELTIPVFEKVKFLAEEEPQSFRDLGLAYAAAKQYQPAIDNLNEVVVRPWDWRFAEISGIALAEMNAIIATSGVKLDTSRIDPRLLKNLPLDLRAVLTWDADNSDMDLWVTDPNGEKCYYGNRFTTQGGRMTRDFTGGYGPEEFSLRRAKPGKYKIEANFFGSTQQIVTGATTLQVQLSSGFGTANVKDQMVTLRLKGNGSTVFVGEFEVKAK